MNTKYVVLKREGGHTEGSVPEDGSPATTREIPESWLEIARVDATNDRQAIKAAAAETGENLANGAVAVPVRSWRPRKREVTTLTRELWS